MSTEDKLGEVIRRAARLLPNDIGHRLLALVSPAALAVMAGVVVVWAGSHFIGVGEIADVVMLAAGWLMIGSAAVQGSRKLIAFAVGTYRARSEAELDAAAKDLAEAIGILGVDVVLGLLFKGRPQGTFRTVYRPTQRIPTLSEFTSAMPRAGPMRMYEAELIFTKGRFAGQAGTNLKNVARVGRDFVSENKSAAEAFREVAKAAYHERVHQRLTQAFSLLGRPGLYIKMSAYKRSFILRYIEEAAAETYGLYKAGGRTAGEVAGYRFPLNGNYEVTLRQLGTEAKGILLGPVVVGGTTYQVFVGPSHDRH